MKTSIQVPSDPGELNRSGTDGPARRVSWRQTFAFALLGAVEATAHERNMRIHFAASLGSLAYCLVFRPALLVTAAVSVMCWLVIAAEVFNTAIEALTDLVTGGEPHALAKVAKDAAAGAVLLTSFAALTVAFWLVESTIPWQVRLFSTTRVDSAALSLFSMIPLLGLGILGWWRRTSVHRGPHAGPARRRRPE